MFINLFYFLFKGLSKITGQSFSFSNDGEDFILFKYLAKIKKGNYVDLGSHHPVKGSNTFLFYLLGWRGICVDPIPSLKNKYKFFRKSDKFINSGVVGSNSENQNKLKFYYYKNHTDNSTFDYNRVKELKKKFGREPSSITYVPKINVNEIIYSNKECLIDHEELYLLNLDIEGFEINILNDFFSCNIYPWVVCVEEIGHTAETLKNGKVYRLMKDKGYILGSRTFLSSIYILKSKLISLPSPYIKELVI